MTQQPLTLNEFRAQSRWLPHRDKKPFSAITGKASDWNKPSAWADHANATAAGGRNVGVVVGDGLVAIDLDDALWRDVSGEKPVTRVKTAFKPLFDLALKKGCQSAFKFDPVSASNFDPFERRVLTVALASSELAGVAETRRARDA